MDQHHHHQQHPHQQEHIDMQHDPGLAQAQYGFYHPQEAADPAYAIPFPHQMANYEVVPAAPPPRGLIHILVFTLCSSC